ncbi:HNH endonuclease [Frankia sp. Ag45/Mut15]|uniref:HNH endonuclease n=1 Tax=Frankia umida TaxID=573489 RepID=A0ABT0K3Y8_9ACTN|nr:HNH endonuclease signature motif containing protein [Frankia umida]MCK9878229.1 HNH endonuclease [Frankia umida]
MLIHPNDAAGPEPHGGPPDGTISNGQDDLHLGVPMPADLDFEDSPCSSNGGESFRLDHKIPEDAEKIWTENSSEGFRSSPQDSAGSVDGLPAASASGGRGLPEAERLLGLLDAAVNAMLGSEKWRWSSDDVTEALCALHETAARLAAVRSLVLLEAEDRGLAKDAGAADLSCWLAGRMVMAKHEAAQQVALAQQLFAGPYQATGEALTDARISEAHAQVIRAGMEALPAEVPEEIRARAEQQLIEDAQQLDPSQLKRAAIRLREQLTEVDSSPGGDDPHEDSRTGEHSRSRRADKNSPDDSGEGDGQDDSAEGASARSGQQRDPHSARQLTFVDTPEGTTLIRGELDPEGAGLLRTALDALSAPAPTVNGQRDPRSPARRRADALVEFVRHALCADVGPSAGGTRPHLSVVIGWETLLGDANDPGMTNWDLPLPLEVIRRIACDAQVSRIVLGPEGVPLDVGRAERVVPAHIRRVLVSRDNCCAFPYCNRPPSWCDAHHVRHWTDGGPTSLDNLVLLCGQHHSQVHREHWQIVMGEDRRPSFIPPAFIDSQRRPRRNPYSQPLPDIFSSVMG